MTTLTATPLPGSVSTPPSVLLSVAAAPSLAPVYVSNFATADGWAATQSGTLTLVTGSTGIPAARMVSRPDNLSTFTKTLTGLTVLADYEVSLYYVTASGRVALGAAGQTFTPYVYSSTRAPLKVAFRAFASSVTLNVIAYPNPTIGTDYGDVTIDTVRVVRTGAWAGTTIRRSDVNGAGVLVRAPYGLDTTGTDGSATMTLTDYEAALTGPVVYTVTDGLGGTANAALYGSETNLVLNPTVDSPTGGGTANWSPSGSGTTQGRVAGNGTTGTSCLYVTTGTAATSGTSTLATGVTAGRTYGARIACLPPVTSDLRITIQWQDNAAGATGSAAATVTACPAGVWQALAVTAVAPAGTTQARVYVQRVNDSTSGLTLYVDAALLAEVPAGSTLDAGTYFDGSLPGCYWTGTAHASSSVRGTSPPAGSAPGVWVTLPGTANNPGVPTAAAVTAVTGITEASRSNGTVHVVVGRADPLVNAGPLSTRAGTFDLYCPDYAAAETLRNLLASGAVALLRQPTYPGLDLYFTVTQLDVANEQPTPTQRWKASVGYLEVLPP